ncbi:MAG: hypothetical protein D6689_07135, partial [Deltaproteobacteria bacterium]
MAVAAVAALSASGPAAAQVTKSRITVLLDNSGSMLQTPEIVDLPSTCTASGFSPCTASGGPVPDTRCNACVSWTIANLPSCASNWTTTCRNTYRNNCWQAVTGQTGCGNELVFTESVATRGDGSAQHPGCDVDGDGLADDSRIYQAKNALQIVVATFGEVEFSLWRFAGLEGGQSCTNANQCPTVP